MGHEFYEYEYKYEFFINVLKYTSTSALCLNSMLSANCLNREMVI